MGMLCDLRTNTIVSPVSTTFESYENVSYSKSNIFLGANNYILSFTIIGVIAKNFIVLVALCYYYY